MTSCGGKRGGVKGWGNRLEAGERRPAPESRREASFRPWDAKVLAMHSPSEAVTEGRKAGDRVFEDAGDDDIRSSLVGGRRWISRDGWLTRMGPAACPSQSQDMGFRDITLTERENADRFPGRRSRLGLKASGSIHSEPVPEPSGSKTVTYAPSAAAVPRGSCLPCTA